VTKRSWVVGLTNNVASSAYQDILKLAQLPWRKLNSPESWANLKSMCNSSIAKRNSIREKGSPCLTPRWWEMDLPGSPLIKNLEEEDAHIADIQFLQQVPKPRKVIISRR
jgi:hypothetical protein